MTKDAARDGVPLSVLVVDDDPLIAMCTVDMLEDLGHRVLEAHDGAEALRLLAAEPTIGLIITDQAMPEMTGAELVRRARARRPGLPVLLATGYGGGEADTAGLPRLAKPFQQSDLARAIEKVLG